MNAENLIDKIDNSFKTGARVLVAAGILYLGSLAISYSAVDSWRTIAKRHESEVAAKIDFSHFYNPLRFWQDNGQLVQKAKEMDEKNPLKVYSPLFPGTG